MLGRILCFLLLCLATVACHAEEVVTIPLEKVWGHDRPLRELEPEYFAYRNTPEKIREYSDPKKIQEMQSKAKDSLVLAIERVMNGLSEVSEQNAGTGFAVHGRDRKALREVHKVLVKGEKPESAFYEDTELSIAFFARPAQPKVRLLRGERHGSVIKIYYGLISHGLGNLTWNLAMIPVGKLPPGEYQVELIRASDEEAKYRQRDLPAIESGKEEQIVCKRFQFAVTQRPQRNRE